MSILILLNKPFHVLSQFKDDNDRATLKQFLPNHPGVYPAGRLDYDSEGLLLLTDDGALQHQISHPNHKQSKTYWVQVEGQISEQDILPLQQGITLKDGLCRPATVSIISEPELWQRTPAVRERKNIPTSWIEITITEGRNRQVRRMTAAINFPTLRLIRAKIGNWQLDDLQPGEYKELTVHSPSREKKAPKLPHKSKKHSHSAKNKPSRHTTRRKRPL